MTDAPLPPGFRPGAIPIIGEIVGDGEVRPANPSAYDSGRTLTIKLAGDVSAKLATYRREMHPGFTDEQVAAYLIRDSLVRLGVLPLPEASRSKGARRGE